MVRRYGHFELFFTDLWDWRASVDSLQVLYQLWREHPLMQKEAANVFKEIWCISSVTVGCCPTVFPPNFLDPRSSGKKPLVYSSQTYTGWIRLDKIGHSRHLIIRGHWAGFIDNSRQRPDHWALPIIKYDICMTTIWKPCIGCNPL